MESLNVHQQRSAFTPSYATTAADTTANGRRRIAHSKEKQSNDKSDSIAQPEIEPFSIQPSVVTIIESTPANKLIYSIVNWGVDYVRLDSGGYLSTQTCFTNTNDWKKCVFNSNIFFFTFERFRLNDLKKKFGF